MKTMIKMMVLLMMMMARPDWDASATCKMLWACPRQRRKPRGFSEQTSRSPDEGISSKRYCYHLYKFRLSSSTILILNHTNHHHLEYKQLGHRDVNQVSQRSIAVDQRNLRRASWSWCLFASYIISRWGAPDFEFFVRVCICLIWTVGSMRNVMCRGIS